MSFLFGGTTKPNTTAINAVIEQIDGADKLQELTYTTQLEFKTAENSKDYVINVLDFFENTYGNLRPKALEVRVKNYSEKEVSAINAWYLHTPVPKQYLNYQTMSQFQTHSEFVDTLQFSNTSPYMTLCNYDQGGLQDIDVSQITNVNVVPYRKMFVSLGQLVFQLQRKVPGPVTLELTFKLKYTLKQY